MITFFILFASTNSLQAMTEEETIEMVETIAIDTAMNITVDDAAKKMGYAIIGKTLYHISINTNTVMSSMKMIRFSRTLATANTKFKFPNKLDWIFILSDVLIDALTYESDKAKKLMIKTFYGNLKAGMQYGLATNAIDKMGAGITWAETNALAFYGSVTGSWELYKEQVELEISTKYAEDYSTMINLYKQYEVDYCRSAPKDKRIIKNTFLAECRITFKNDNFFADPEGDLYYKNWCLEYSNRAETFDEIKLYNLIVLKNEGHYIFTTEADFDTYINKFFHISERNTIYRLWHSINFDPDLQVSKNETSHKFLSKAHLYGYYPYDFVFDDTKGTLFNPIGKVKINLGVYAIEDSCRTVAGSAGSIDLSNVDPEPYMTRIQAAQYINEIFQLDAGLSSYIKQWLSNIGESPEMNGWSYHPIILWQRKIAKGNINTDGTITDFRPNDDISSFELLVMLTNAMDYKTCGQAGCTDLSVLNNQLGEQQ